MIHEMEDTLSRRVDEHNHYVKISELKLSQYSTENSDIRQELDKKESEVRI